jgi:hypothetical protein
MRAREGTKHRYFAHYAHAVNIAIAIIGKQGLDWEMFPPTAPSG